MKFVTTLCFSIILISWILGHADGIEIAVVHQGAGGNAVILQPGPAPRAPPPVGTTTKMTVQSYRTHTYTEASALKNYYQKVASAWKVSARTQLECSMKCSKEDDCGQFQYEPKAKYCELLTGETRLALVARNGMRSYNKKAMAYVEQTTLKPTSNDKPTKDPSLDAIECAQNYVKSDQGRCYKFSKNPKSFQNARVECRNFGGELVTLSDQAEILALATLQVAHNVPDHMFWTDGIVKTISDEPRWASTGIPIASSLTSSSPFLQSQRDLGDKNGCVVVYLMGKYIRAVLCDDTNTYICERDPMKPL